MPDYVEIIECNGWQPIETAPKDGTNVLLCCYNNGKYVSIHMACYAKGVDGNYRWYGEYDGYETHWMPLPAPPKQG